MTINIEKNVNEIKVWLQDYLKNTGAKGFVLGVSGGKDSAVVASLLVSAVGKEKVFGVLMPNGEQSDISDSVSVCENLGISYTTINVNQPYEAIVKSLPTTNVRETKINIVPRVRMTTLYAIASEMNYLVVGTGNASERFVGYFTKWGDGACDLNPIGEFTTEEVVKIGEYLGSFEGALYKNPSDGISGSSDEEKMGVSYKEINIFMQNNKVDDKEHEQIIVTRNKQNQHKLMTPPLFKKVL